MADRRMQCVVCSFRPQQPLYYIPRMQSNGFAIMLLIFCVSIVVDELGDQSTKCFSIF